MMKLGAIGHYFTGRVCMAAIVVQSWANQIDGEPLVSVMAWNEDGSENPQRIVDEGRAAAHPPRRVAGGLLRLPSRRAAGILGLMCFCTLPGLS